MINIFERFMRSVFGEKCEHCGSRKTVRSSGYTRGWNNLCDQAIGSPGIFCTNCYHTTFDQPQEEWKKSLPEWCRVYEE